jgi:hypothetical protein
MAFGSAFLLFIALGYFSGYYCFELFRFRERGEFPAFAGITSSIRNSMKGLEYINLSQNIDLTLFYSTKRLSFLPPY